MSKVTAKKLWGESFHVVPEGLDEDEVVKYVDKLKVELDRQSALQKLAEQTVVEADKLAGSIKDRDGRTPKRRPPGSGRPPRLRPPGSRHPPRRRPPG